MPSSITVKSGLWRNQLRQWHWISSAISLMGLLLFSVTGFTLNHAAQIEAEPKVTKREGLITQTGFVRIEELKKKLDELETWSQIALEVLEHPTVPRWSTVRLGEICQEAQSHL